MRGRTKLVLVAGGATAAVAGGVFARGRIQGGGPDLQRPDDDAIFTVYAPGGKYAFICNGPVGWVTSRLMPIIEANVYSAVAEMLDLQPDDELLDIGCGPGAFLATKAQHVRRVVGLDPSPTMLGAAERRLAGRLAAGTARLVSGSAAALPFGDGEFSAVTAIFAPLSHAEAFRVLRPGGRLVFADPSPRRSSSDPTSSWGTRLYDEADHRRRFEEAGFTEVTLRYRGSPPLAGELLVGGRRPAATLDDGVAGGRDSSGDPA
jgi:SAM-dependent methyltransferase